MANGGVDYAPNGLHYRVTLPLRPRESETIDTTGNRPAPVHVADIEDTQYQMQLSEEALTAVPAHADVYPYLQRVAQQMERVFNATQPSETRFVHEGLPAVQAVAKSGAWQ